MSPFLYFFIVSLFSSKKKKLNPGQHVSSTELEKLHVLEQWPVRTM